MADVRVDRPAYVSPVGVSGTSEERPRQQQGDRRRADQPDDQVEGVEGDAEGGMDSGREELAVALDQGGRSLVAQFEQGPSGAPQVRILDRQTGGTVAVMTPDELRAIAEQTGLPSGLLFTART